MILNIVPKVAYDAKSCSESQPIVLEYLGRPFLHLMRVYRTQDKLISEREGKPEQKFECGFWNILEI
jgi:hypothetical protein